MTFTKWRLSLFAESNMAADDRVEGEQWPHPLHVKDAGVEKLLAEEQANFGLIDRI